MTATSKPRIRIVYTGGTIGMVQDPKTHDLVPFNLAHLMQNVPKIGELGCELSHVQLEHPIDSSNMDPTVWAEVRDLILEGSDEVDGYVVLHGTDTMAYTASALSFMLLGFGKPVILTGSQLPIGDVREDGTENLITAIQIAAARDAEGGPMVQEVAISFARHLWRGNRSTKVSSTDFEAFRSFNHDPLAAMDLHIVFDEDLLLRPNRHEMLAEVDPYTSKVAMDDAVDVVFIRPGMTKASLESALRVEGLKGVILRTFGAGNAPTAAWFIDTIADAVRKGIVVVNVTQCPAGGVEEKRYATGDALAGAGVVSGYDMTCESALAKMMWLFGMGKDASDVARLMQVPMAGELTVTAPR